jgi:hypothetical protein
MGRLAAGTLVAVVTIAAAGRGAHAGRSLLGWC